MKRDREEDGTVKGIMRDNRLPQRRVAHPGANMNAGFFSVIIMYIALHL